MLLQKLHLPLQSAILGVLAWERITRKICKEDFDANSLTIDIERVKEAMHEASVTNCNRIRILSRAKKEIGIEDSSRDV